jgi:hypothetical protein
LLRSIRLEPLPLFRGVELVFVLHHILLRLLVLLLPHSKRLFTELLLLHATLAGLPKLILLKVAFLLEISRPLKLLPWLAPALSEVLLLVIALSVSVRVCSIAIIIAGSR